MWPASHCFILVSYIRVIVIVTITIKLLQERRRDTIRKHRKLIFDKIQK